MADTHNGDAAAAAALSSSSSSAGGNNPLLSSQIEERLIAQEYKIWKKNTPFLYDFVVTHGLEWPSLTCQWLPTCKTLADGSRVGAVSGTSGNIAEQHELLIGTHTAATSGNGGEGEEDDNGGGGGEMNYLMVVTVNLPRDDPVVAAIVDTDNKSRSGSPMTKKIKTTSSNNDNDEAAATDATAASGSIDPSPKSIIIDVPEPATNYNEEKEELGGYSHVAAAAATTSAASSSSSSTAAPKVGKIEIKLKIPHEGEVNRARYMPQNHFIVSTRGPSPDVYIWDLSKHSSILSNGSTSSAIATSTPASTTNINRPNPNVICRGHEGEGYGMAWCSIAGNENYGKLVTCAEDKTVRLWHVSEGLKSLDSPMIIDPIITFRYHTDVVEDVDWHNFDVNMIGSCGDDGNICLWDIRKDPTVPIHVVNNAHGPGGDVNGMEFHLANEFLFATGGSDKVVKLWDVRNLKSPLQTLEGHTDQVFTVRWSPFDESLLASCSADRRIALWDLSRIGCEQSVEDAEDGPPELLFLHGGHTSRVNDFSWNPNYEWCIAGVSEDNVMQIWCPAEDVYAEDDNDDDEGEENDLATRQRAEILKDDELE